VSLHHLSHKARKSVEQSDMYCLKSGIKKKIFLYILPICQEVPHEQISIKFCTTVEVVDIITCNKFFSDQLRNVDSVGAVKNGGFNRLNRWLIQGCATASPVMLVTYDAYFYLLKVMFD